MVRFAAPRPRQIDGPPRLLHAHGSFSLGGKEARAVRLMNLWGDRARHSIVSAAPQLRSARDAIDPATPVDFPEPPPLAGRPGLGRFRAIAAFLADYDLVLSYNWGAMDAVMARRIHGGPPLIHHEDGFNADEAGGLKPQRNLYRRLERKSGVEGKSVSVRVDLGGRRIIKKKKKRMSKNEYIE